MQDYTKTTKTSKTDNMGEKKKHVDLLDTTWIMNMSMFIMISIDHWLEKSRNLQDNFKTEMCAFVICWLLWRKCFKRLNGICMKAQGLHVGTLGLCSALIRLPIRWGGIEHNVLQVCPQIWVAIWNKQIAIVKLVSTFIFR